MPTNPTTLANTEQPGYPIGTGGTVTQITTIATAVELNKLAGRIITVASTLAAGAEAEFTVTNSKVALTSVIVLSTTYAGGGSPWLSVKGVAAGSFVVMISNAHATDALNALLSINFVVLDAPTS